MNTKFNLLTPLRIVCPTNTEMAKATASEIVPIIEELQPDLLYMDSVLVSTGENKNTDVFLPEEMWKARSSPILKPVNWEHNSGKEIIGQINAEQASAKSIIEDNQIIGGMYNSFVALKDGTVVSSEMEQAKGFVIPQEFDIINQAVIYKYLYPKTAARIVQDARAGQLFVSMEAWFGNYDYKVGNKIVARNEETAFLDAHLRANGGDGSFGNVNVGRVLRNIVFGGVGIVANPANEDSVIHSFTNASLQQTNIVHSAVASNIIGEIQDASASMESQEVIEIMSENKTENNAPAVASISSEDYKNVVERLVKAEHTIEQRDAAVASAQAEAEKLQASVDSLTTAFVEGTKSLAEVLGSEASSKLQDADAGSFFNVLAGTIGEKLEASKSLEEQLAEATSKVAELEVEKRSIARSTEIEKLLAEYIQDGEALAARKEKMVSATKNLDDEAFAATLEDTKDLLSVAAKPDFLKKKDEDKKKEGMKKDAGLNKKGASATDEGITDPAILDNVKATASVSAGNEVVPTDDGNSNWKALAEDLLGVKKS